MRTYFLNVPVHEIIITKKCASMEAHVQNVCIDRIPQNVFNCVSAVRMASSGSTREPVLKMTSSALLMSRNGKQSSQFPLGWGHLQFCEFTQSWWLRVPNFPLVCKRCDVLIQYYLKRSPTERLKMYVNWYCPILGIQPFVPSSVITWRLSIPHHSGPPVVGVTVIPLWTI